MAVKDFLGGDGELLGVCGVVEEGLGWRVGPCVLGSGGGEGDAEGDEGDDLQDDASVDDGVPAALECARVGRHLAGRWTMAPKTSVP